MRWSNKRESLARGLRAAGLLGLIERLNRRPGLLVLAYHRIGPADDPFYDPIISADADAFRAQVRYLRDHARLVNLAEALALIADDARPDGSCALITFDDGYRDNLDVAVPILREVQAPAAFFLATGFFDRPRLPWWDHVAYAVKHASADHLTLDRPEPLDLALPRGDRRAAVRTVIAAYLRADRPDDPDLLDHLADRAGVAIDPAALGRSLFLDWDGARALHAASMDVAAHTVNHPRLARLPEPDQAAELAESKGRLEDEIGVPIDAVAYPFGDADAFTAATQTLARAAGFRAAFSLLPGLNRPGATAPMAVRRLLVGPTDTPPLFRARVALTAALGNSPL